MVSDKSSPAWRIALFILVVASVLWLGGAHARLLIANQLLQFGTLEFNPYLSPESERELFRLLSFSSLTVFVAYVAALVSASIFLWISPFQMKREGWLLMSAILFYAFVPVEGFLIYLDIKMMYLEFFTTESNGVFRELFIARMGALAGAPFVATLCYYTIIGLAIFQPFKKQIALAA